MRRQTTLNVTLPILMLAVLSGAAFASCAPDRVSIRGEFGQIDFQVEVADDPLEREVGLMHREELPRQSGMLFVYPRPQPLSFWMRNTLIPLDMIFVDPDGRIAHIHENAIPLDETPISGGAGRLAVLEINGGLARRFGLSVGDELRHPAFDRKIALWPCDGA